MRAYNFVGSGHNLMKTLPGDVVRGHGDNVDTNFARGAPTKFGRVKNVQNSARFLTTFYFDREYLRKGSKI